MDNELFEEYRKYRESIDKDFRKRTSLFNDPYLANMKKNLPPEIRKEYEEIGKEMYSFDYTSNGEEFELKQKAEKIIKVLKLGLEVSDLKDDEKEILRKFLGDDWVDKYEEYKMIN